MALKRKKNFLKSGLLDEKILKDFHSISHHADL